MYTVESLREKTLSELKEIGWQINVLPDGDRRCRRNWIEALANAQAPLPEVPIEKSLDVEPIEPLELCDLDAALAEVARLRAENAELMQQVRSHKQTINAAKDITPVQKCSFIRVLKLARAACLDLTKSLKGEWILSLGSLQRTFKSLHEIWRLLVPGEWNLSDLFTQPEKKPIPADGAMDHDRVSNWFSAFCKVGARPVPSEEFPPKPIFSRFAAIPFCDDELIDSYALGFAGVESAGRSPPGGGDAML